jgi:PilZ domain
MYLPTSRSDRRIRKEVAVELARPGSSEAREMAIAENVSARGMRVKSQDIWLPGDRVLLTSPGFGVDTRARVVYCQHLGNNRFALGLELLTPCNGPSRISSSRESFRNIM